VGPGKVDATLKDGVLRIEIVKTAPAETKKIEVKWSSFLFFLFV